MLKRGRKQLHENVIFDALKRQYDRVINEEWISQYAEIIYIKMNNVSCEK